MDFLKRRHRPGLLTLLIMSLPAVTYGHGGVVAEDDLCVINIAYLQAHFKIYVPAATGHREFCEDIPVRGESVFVMEYLHDSLATSPIGFRIIRNTTGKGRFARLSDVLALPDLEAVTVRYEAPATVPGVYTLLHDFEEDGEYIGIVTAGDDGGRALTAVFPFRVGDRSFGIWPWVFTALLLLQLNYWFWWRRGRAATAATAITVPLLLVLVFTGSEAIAGESLSSDAGRFKIEYAPSLEPLVINRMHHWELVIRGRDGLPVSGARVEVAGGMPEHDHGLATVPKVVALGNGHYRIEGLRFHMPGAWVLELAIDDGNARDRVTIHFTL